MIAMNFRPFLLALTAVALLPSLAHAAPPNDDFANRVVLTGQAVSSAPVVIDDATREGLEPSDTGDQTVWYTWTAPANGTVTMTTAESQPFFQFLTVFNGTDCGNLVEMAQSNTRDADAASLTFFVEAGFTYQICLGSDADAGGGNMQLNIVNRATTLTAPAVVGSLAGTNDNFAAAVPLSGPTVSAFSYGASNTREGLEPTYTGDQTSWWIWTAPADAQVTMNTAGSPTFAVLSVMNGNNLGNLTRVAYDSPRDSDAAVTFPARAGTSYLVSIGTSDEDIGIDSVLNISTAPLSITSPVIIESAAAANDNFASAQDLGANAQVSGIGFNVDATSETTEPAIDRNATLWWTWTAPQDGVLSFSAAGTSFGHELTAYAGASLAAPQFLSTAASTYDGTPASGAFNVAAGSTYHFVIGTPDGSTGTAVLNLNFAAGLSHVGIAANAKTVDYDQTHEVFFTLTRTGDLTKKAVIAYKVKLIVDGGTRKLTGTKKFKPNKACASLPVNVSYLGGTEGTLKVTLSPGIGYVVDHPNAKSLLKTE